MLYFKINNFLIYILVMKIEKKLQKFTEQFSLNKIGKD